MELTGTGTETVIYVKSEQHIFLKEVIDTESEQTHFYLKN